jgi:cytochrome bd-type quinol oxidase subunit 2
LKVGLIWWIIGMLLASGYFFYVYRTFAGKITANGDGHAHGD